MSLIDVWTGVTLSGEVAEVSDETVNLSLGRTKKNCSVV
jgi:hypothetical protein